LVTIALDPLLLQRTAVLMQRKDAYQTTAARALIDLALDVAEALTRCSKQACTSDGNIHKINTIDSNI
jgi:LysR family cyn operon transcriptional activator